MKNDMKYDHVSIEAKWQEIWKNTKLNEADITNAPMPYYNLMMFPYPSAEGLHVGNMYAFTGSDIYGRYMRLQGYNVFEPIGLDGFGIHSENFALKIGRHPMDHASLTQINFYKQMYKTGAMYDWSRTVETYDPNYYQWTQWLFIQMFKHGLAYRSKAEVNWCPSDKTVLADEQVIEGKCERCGNIVEKRKLEQWFFRITAYAEKLLENISKLKWTNKVLIAQRNWIGKKEGINISYQVVNASNKDQGVLVCFTTTPVNFAATFIVVAPEHPFVILALEEASDELKEKITSYVAETKNKTQIERIAEGRKKTGVFSGLYAINHVTNEKIPIWITDFVIMGVGTGAVQGCPGHDLRDFEFAMQFDIKIKRVVVGKDNDSSPITKPSQVIEHGPGKMINSEFLNGMEFADAMVKTMDYFEEKGWGERVTTYHLRDWLISRQRYWGPPIPMMFCKYCLANKIGERQDMPGYYTVPDKDLPVVLPRIEDYKPGSDGIAPLAKHKEFYEVKCPGCGKKATRETDVSDTFLDSSWYFLRYPSTRSARSGQVPFDPKITKKWLPVDMYTGGAEHSVLHLMYSRFITMALKDWGYIDFEEPFPNFYAHGLVIKDGAKMSKSKGNVVNPDEYIKLYGADALRLYLMFMGPFSEGGDFRDSAMEGMHRWVNRIWRMKVGQTENMDVTKAMHRLIKKAGEDTQKRHYNTVIAAMMEFTNLVWDSGGSISARVLEMFCIILSPYAPHLTEELWERLGKTESVHTQAWPKYDPAMLEDETVTIVVQVNGRLRDNLSVSLEQSKSESAIDKLAQQSTNVAKHLKGNMIKKTIFIPGKLINYVI